MRRVWPLLLAILLAVLLLFGLRSCRGPRLLDDGGDEAPAADQTTGDHPVDDAETDAVAPDAAEIETPTPSAKRDAFAKPAGEPPAPASPSFQPPPVELHTELIPKNIEIIRVYYQSEIGGPGGAIEFDINGSGFNDEFHKMITVESGHDAVEVRDLALVTPNQIHGTLAARANAETKLAYPRVLIRKKPVFQAPEPFAIIRPGEVLNLVFTEMGQTGRTGRFRVYTNLTDEMFRTFRVVPSTPAIRVSELAPSFPFVVHGRIDIGPTVTGGYGVEIFLGEKRVWARDGIIRVVQPNLGATGLVHAARTVEPYHRPGDEVLIPVLGSGFQPADVAHLSAGSEGFALKLGSFTYVSPAQIDLRFRLPADIKEGRYGVFVRAGEKEVARLENAFTVVAPNWTRALRVEPPLRPGGKSALVLKGRDFSDDFIASISVERDEPGLTIGAFALEAPDSARAEIVASTSVKPGDYLLTLTSGSSAVQPALGSIIRVSVD